MNYWSQTTQSDPSKRVSSASLEYLVEVHNFSAPLLASSEVSFQPFFTQLHEIFERCSRAPGWLFDTEDEKLPNYMGIMINQCKDP